MSLRLHLLHADFPLPDLMLSYFQLENVGIFQTSSTNEKFRIRTTPNDEIQSISVGIMFAAMATIVICINIWSTISKKKVKLHDNSRHVCNTHLIRFFWAHL